MTAKHSSLVTSLAGDRICIYCLRQLDAEKFNREHVLSEAFGSFNPPLLLTDCVCQECNQFFGDKLEVRFARGAFEGMLRYYTGMKKHRDGEINLRFVDLAIAEGRGDWSGVRLKLTTGESGVRVSLIPQVAFFNEAERRWVHATAEEIQGLLDRRPDYRNGQMRVYESCPEEHSTIISKLREHGINFKKAGDLQPLQHTFESQLVVEVTLTVNQGIRRCVAKYAFNYLALVCGCEFVRRSDFHAIRHFIRYGGDPPYPLVAETSKPILHDDRPSKRQTGGHLLTLSWDKSPGELVGQVSLFNCITYRVSLCREFSGIWRPIRSGVHYDVDRGLVEPLRGFSKDLAP